jgi:anti-anti-sigma factor
MSSAAVFYPHVQLNERFAAAFEASSRLRVNVELCGAMTVLHVGGDVDISNVASWRCLLTAVSGATTAPGVLVIDIDPSSFLGLCAFTALADISEHCRDRGIDLRLVGTQPCIARVIALCQWDTELPVYPSLLTAARSRVQLGAIGFLN